MTVSLVHSSLTTWQSLICLTWSFYLPSLSILGHQRVPDGTAVREKTGQEMSVVGVWPVLTTVRRGWGPEWTEYDIRFSFGYNMTWRASFLWQTCTRRRQSGVFGRYFSDDSECGHYVSFPTVHWRTTNGSSLRKSYTPNVPSLSLTFQEGSW